ncbi:MAG: PQQ-binding-like beta-propeller repeat protein [Thermogemmatispora sp.]|nr:PQQ-binding-like beta-propeller repeat protein [Thermogemmatispora sp.]
MPESHHGSFADDSSSSGASRTPPSADESQAEAEPGWSPVIAEEPQLVPLPGASRVPFPWLHWWEEARARRWLLGSALGLLLLTLLLAVAIPLLREAFLTGSVRQPSTATTESAALLTSDQSFSLTASGNRLYAFSARGALLALQAQDGHLLWRHDFPVQASQFSPDSPLVLDDVVYISGTCFAASLATTPGSDRPCIPSSGTGTIEAALRASDGHLLWQRVEEGRSFAHTLIKGKLYLAQSQPSVSWLEVLEAKTGKILWQQRFPSSLDGLLPGEPLAVALAEEQPEPGTQLLALASSDGHLIWHQLLADSWRLVARGGSRLYLATEAQGTSGPVAETLLRAADSQSGAQLWQCPIPGQLSELFVSPDGGKLYALTTQKKAAPGNPYGSDVTLLLALRSENAQLLWQHPVNQVLSRAVLAREQDGTLYLALDRQDQPQARLLALSASDGRPLWQQSYKGEGLTSAQSQETTLFLAVSSNAVLTLEGANGQLRWRTRLGEAISYLTLAQAGLPLLYVSTSSGQLYALDIRNGRLRWWLSLAQ